MFRDYADQGYFLEKVFPKNRTRFITVSEPKIDSYLHPETLFGLEVPINGLMNDRFAAKTSRDIRETFAAKRRKGEFIGAFAPYGYRKSPEDKNKLLIDEEAAEVVRAIYHWYVYEGMSKNGIAHRLNELGISSPAAYKRSKGLRFCCPQMEKSGGLWSPRAVASILKNQVYIGTMVQGRQTVISYKVHEKVAVPKEDWYIVPDTHEPVIEKDLFQKAARLQKTDIRTPPAERKRHLLAGLIYCADCKKAMTRQKTKGIVYYHCRTYREQSRNACTKHTVREDVVLKTLTAVIQAQLALAGPLEGAAERSGALWGDREETGRNGRGWDGALERGGLASENGASRFTAALQSRQKELDKVTDIIDGLYGDWKEGMISKEGYLRLKEKYSAKARQLKASIQNLRAQSQETAKTDPYQIDRSLDRDSKDSGRGLLAALIKDIYIHQGGKITIRFDFADPYQLKDT